MSFAYLLDNTDEGDQVTKLGANAVEVFFVQLDAVTQHPFTVVENQVTSDPYGRTGVPVGRAHPRLANLKVTGHSIQERIPPLAAKVLVVYKTDDAVGGGSDTFPGWKVQSRMTTKTEHIGRSLKVTNLSGTVTDPGRLIGPHVYKPVLPLPGTDPTNPNDATHSVIDPASGNTIDLRGLGFNIAVPGPIGSPAAWADNAPTRVIGFDRTATTTDYTISKTAQLFSFARSRAIDSFGGKVNDRDWHGFPPGTILFNAFTQDERITNDGFEYPVVVEVSFNREKWTPIELVETYTTESGEEAEVIRKHDSKLEVVTYEVYPKINMDWLFRMIR